MIINYFTGVFIISLVYLLNILIYYIYYIYNIYIMATQCVYNIPSTAALESTDLLGMRNDDLSDKILEMNKCLHNLTTCSLKDPQLNEEMLDLILKVKDSNSDTLELLSLRRVEIAKVENSIARNREYFKGLKDRLAKVENDSLMREYRIVTSEKRNKNISWHFILYLSAAVILLAGEASILFFA